MCMYHISRRMTAGVSKAYKLLNRNGLFVRDSTLIGGHYSVFHQRLGCVYRTMSWEALLYFAEKIDDEPDEHCWQKEGF
jgi:hypothetical protein